MSDAHHAAEDTYKIPKLIVTVSLALFVAFAALTEAGTAIGGFFQNLSAGLGNSLNILGNAYQNNKPFIHGLIALILIVAIFVAVKKPKGD